MNAMEPRESGGEMLLVIHALAESLDALGLPYYVGGSVASSMLGVMRTTADIDVIVELHRGDGRRLVARMAEQCHGDGDAAERALSEGRPFNLIHLQTMLKFDFFPVANDPLSRSALARAVRLPSGLRIATAEDILLAKLRWFRVGGEVSDRQWGDVLGLLRARGEILEREYLERMADSLGVRDLLARAGQEA